MSYICINGHYREYCRMDADGNRMCFEPHCGAEAEKTAAPDPSLELVRELRALMERWRERACRWGGPDGPGALHECIGDIETLLLRERGAESQEAGGEGVNSRGAIDVLTERRRQIAVEGWTAEHDSQWTHDEIPMAAVCYCLGKTPAIARRWWPWDREWWKPKGGRRRQLVKAAALLLAEIDRMDSIAAAEGSGGEKQ